MNDLPRFRRDIYEVHVTVLPTSDANRFRLICREMKVKTIVIELAEGLPSQPMTCSRIQGTVQAAHAEAQRVSKALAEAGLTITRIKIEAAPWNNDLPITGEGYYEHHARLNLSNLQDQEATLRDLCGTLGVHLSRNPFKTNLNGSQQRFVTLRHPPTWPEVAAQRAADLWQGLADRGFPPEKTVTEFCVYDNNRNLDLAWEQT